MSGLTQLLLNRAKENNLEIESFLLIARKQVDLEAATVFYVSTTSPVEARTRVVLDSMFVADSNLWTATLYKDGSISISSFPLSHVSGIAFASDREQARLSITDISGSTPFSMFLCDTIDRAADLADFASMIRRSLVRSL